MAERSNLPGVTSTILDGGLGVTPPPVDLNDSILIVGTAEDGPLYEPIPLGKKEDAEVIYGRFGKGTLVRGVYEKGFPVNCYRPSTHLDSFQSRDLAPASTRYRRSRSPGNAECYHRGRALR